MAVASRGRAQGRGRSAVLYQRGSLPPTQRGRLIASLSFSGLGVFQLALLGGLSLVWLPVALGIALFIWWVARSLPDD